MLENPIPVVAAVFYRKNQWEAYEVLLFRRAAHNSGAGNWEFPGGKIEKNESEVQALEREILEELSIQIKVQQFVGVNIHKYPNKTIELKAYLVEKTSDSDFRLLDHDQLDWFDVKTIQNIQVAAADVPLIDNVFKVLSQLEK